ncbi:MAG: TonB-dependent receptor [Opitutaceae bacterium]
MTPRLVPSPFVVVSALCCAAPLGYAADAPSEKRSFNLPRGDATTTLNQFAGTSGRQIIYMMDKVRGEQTNAVAGAYSPQEALERMLAGTRLTASQDRSTGAFVVSRRRNSGATDPAGEGKPDPDPQPPPKPESKPLKSKTPLARVALLLTVLAGVDANAQTSLPTTPPTKDVVSTEEAITLSPFTVDADRESGYQATSTLAGTRINTSVKDIGASISIYTKDLINDLGVTNMNELLIYATGMEAAGPGGNFSGSGNDINAQQTTGDSVRTNPQGGSRTRGLAGPNYTRNFFTSSIPIDSYNTGTVTVSRGPNAVLFGVGSPAGVVDTALQAANVDRNSTQVEFRYGNNESLRSSFNLNRVLIPKKLALRIAALDDQEQYNQRPAFEHKERVYGALTARPFRSTTVRANFESGRSKANRPITLLPFNSINQQWIDAGRPGFDWTFYDDPDRNPNARTQNASTFVPLSMGQNQIFDQIAFIYNQPNQSAPSFGFRATTPSGNAANQVRAGVLHPTVNRDLVADNITFVNTRNIGEIPGAAFPGGLVPAGLKFQGFTDFSIFDFKNRMLDETSRQRESFRNVNVTLEQLVWQDKAGVEVAYGREFYERQARNSFFQAGNNNHIRVDTSVKLPNGQPNPNYGRPFAQYGGGNWSDPETAREAYRATAFLRYNFKDLNPTLGKWLGRHAVTGLYENSAVEALNNNSRLAVYGPAADALLQADTAFGRRPTLLAYIGDSVLNGAPLRIQPIQIAIVDAGISAPTSYFSSPASTTVQGDFVTATTTLQPIGETASFNREVIKSQAAVLQSYWLGEHVVTTFGWRRDESYRGTINVPYNPAVSTKVYYAIDDFDLPSTPALQAAKEIKSYSGVLRWPHRWYRLPLGMDVSVFGNASENFTPAGGRVNVFNEGLGSPEGKTRELGLNLSFLNDRLFLRLNRFKTSVVGATISGTSGAYTNAYNNGVAQMASFWAVEQNTNPNIDRSADIELLWSALPANFRELIGWKVLGTAAEGNLTTTVAVFPQQRSDTTDYEAKGTEFEVSFNPNRQWRLLLNVAKQETVQSNIAPQAKDFIQRMLPVWEKLGDRPRNNYPTGHVLGTPLPATSQTVTQWLNSPQGPLVPYAALIASEGVASAEQRKWRANLVANYTFANDGRLKGWNLGTGIRWQDKLGIG